MAMGKGDYLPVFSIFSFIMYYLHKKLKNATWVQTCLNDTTDPGQHRVAAASVGHQGDQAFVHIIVSYRCQFSIGGSISTRDLEAGERKVLDLIYKAERLSSISC